MSLDTLCSGESCRMTLPADYEMLGTEIPVNDGVTNFEINEALDASALDEPVQKRIIKGNHFPRPAQLVGKRYGRLVVEKLHSMEKGGRRRWFCKCDCGGSHTATSNVLNMGNAKSCGCLVAEVRITNGERLAAFNSKPHGVAAFNGAKNGCIQGAKSRGLSFSLTDDEFRRLTSSFCFYCGAAPSRTVKPTKGAKSGNYICNGIDRIDSSLGYVIENCVACCWTCNHAKSSMAVDKFEAWVNRTAKFTQIKQLSAEEILEIVIDQFRDFQSDPNVSQDDEDALYHVETALECLQKRTIGRLERGVEGSSAQ